MAHTVNLIYAHITQLSSQMAELRAENKELRTIVGGLRGDINRTEEKVEKSYKLSIDNLERGNVTGDLVEFIHRQESLRIKPTLRSTPLPARPKTPIPALPLPQPPPTIASKPGQDHPLPNPPPRPGSTTRPASYYH